MDPNNITCIQRIRFFFHFFEKREWKPGEVPPLQRIVKEKKINPQEVRNLKNFLNWRLERIAGMMEVLFAIHNDWAVNAKKDFIQMETQSLDFNDALNVLKEHGFTDDEFILKVEYERKWGVL